MKKVGLLLCVLLYVARTFAQTPVPEVPPTGEDAHSFIVANDLGRNGWYEQKTIAELMGGLAEKMDIEFVAALGDVHHFEGVASVDDPLWLTNYELIYTHPELMLPWYAILGNHEYRGNTQAVLDYARRSRRWSPLGRCYAVEQEAGDREKMLLVFIDTTPLIDKYRNDREDYPDAAKQNREKQLRWIEKTLKNSTAKWKIVMGHHPVYADTGKDESERQDMQRRLKPLLDAYGVDMYICGHIHNFQHLQPAGSKVHYVVNSSASLAREVKPVAGTLFCSPEAGFSVVSADDDSLSLYMIDSKGKIIHTITVEK